MDGRTSWVDTLVVYEVYVCMYVCICIWAMYEQHRRSRANMQIDDSRQVINDTLKKILESANE